MPKANVDEVAVKSYVADFSVHKGAFVLSPKQWKNFFVATSLNWQRKLLCHGNVASIPEQRGVYAHSISVNMTNMPPTDYITYVGLVGDKKSTSIKGPKRTLKQRFTEYLKEAEGLGRPLVWNTLSKYRGYIWFHYAEVPDLAVSLHQIETALLDALLPPCNQESFSINIKQAHQIVYR